MAHNPFSSPCLKKPFPESLQGLRAFKHQLPRLSAWYLKCTLRAPSPRPSVSRLALLCNGVWTWVWFSNARGDHELVKSLVIALDLSMTASACRPLCTSRKWTSSASEAECPRLLDSSPTRLRRLPVSFHGTALCVCVCVREHAHVGESLTAGYSSVGLRSFCLFENWRQSVGLNHYLERTKIRKECVSSSAKKNELSCHEKR